MFCKHAQKASIHISSRSNLCILRGSKVIDITRNDGSGNLGFYQLFENEWKPKYSESPLRNVSESRLIGLLTPSTAI